MKLIKNGKILKNGILKDTEILIDGKRIKQISSKINASSSNIEVIDAKRKFNCSRFCRCSCAPT